ncbi:MAG: hypothetical protein ACTHK3_03310 [Solirubrobacterales bacterium]
MEILTEALLAAALADKAEPASRRPRWSHEGAEPVKKLLRAETKEVRPRKPRQLKQKTTK